MKARTNRFFFIGILLLSGALVWVVAGTLEPKITSVGDTAPNFSVVTESGKTITRSDFGGKLLVLNFWATWCPPCIDETPSLKEFARQYRSKGVVVLGVSIDRNEKLYQRFLKQWQIAYEVARDPESDISASYGTFQIPESYIIGRDGKVLEKIISNQNWMDPEFLARVNRML